MSSVLPYTNAAWEQRSIFLNFLISKLPSPKEADLSKGILDAIDMDSYRVEKRTMQKIVLPGEDAEVEPVPTSEGGNRPEAELDRLSNIINAFNDLFGDIEWEDRDRVHQLITETIPSRVAADTASKNARENSDKENTRIEHDKALERVVMALMKDDAALFKQYMDNASFKRWMTDTQGQFLFGDEFNRINELSRDATRHQIRLSRSKNWLTINRLNKNRTGGRLEQKLALDRYRVCHRLRVDAGSGKLR